MTTLEKLKELEVAYRNWSCASIPDLVHREKYLDGILKMFASEDLPRLIAALEWVEREHDRLSAIPLHMISDSGNGKLEFAEELLTRLEGKGE